MMIAGIIVFLVALAVRLEWWWGLHRAGAVSPAPSAGALQPEPQAPDPSKPDPADPRLPAGISVVIALRNEEANVDGLVQSFVSQRVPPGVEVEFVLVDDGSTDATRSRLLACAARDVRIRIVDGVGQGKKTALTAGIGAARFERLAFTDADCRPGPGWLGALAAHHAVEPRAVFIGYAPLTAEATLLGYYQRYDALLTGLWAAAACGRRRPFLATGRNLSYPKSLFIAVGGFKSHADTLSGDDDLFVQDVVRVGAAPIHWLSEEESHVASPAQPTFRTWWHQKRRHLSAGRHYRMQAHARLAVWQLSDLAVWALPFFSMALLSVPAAVLSVHAFILWSAAPRADRDLIWWLPVLAPLMVLYNLVVPLTTVIRPPRTWAARSPS